MRRRYNFGYVIIASIVTLSLKPPTVNAAPQAQIAFSSNRDGNWEIYVMNADGRNKRKLTNTPYLEWHPSWSPDGKHIAFTANGDGNMKFWHANLEIYVMNADGGNQQNLTKNFRHDSDPAWSPDGKRIAYVSAMDRNKEIHVMEVDGENQRRLTNSGNVHIHNWEPTWSPDGERIAFTSNRDGNLEIYVMNADGGNQQRLTNSGDVRIHNWNPSWSPDGERIAFTSNRDRNSEIYVMNTEGGELQNRTKGIHGDDSSWSPDGKRIAFVSERNGNKKIYTINADGRRDLKQLTDNPHDDTDPAWYDPAVAFAVAPAGKKFAIWGWLKQVNR